MLSSNMVSDILKQLHVFFEEISDYHYKPYVFQSLQKPVKTSSDVKGALNDGVYAI